MKKKFPFLAIPLCLATSSILFACNKSSPTYEDSDYLIEAVGYEDVHQETIHLREVAYDNTYFKANIFGSICKPKTQFSKTYTIPNQKVTFAQVYGHIWSTDLAVKETTSLIKVYASRAGENHTGEGKIIECGERRIKALEMKTYKHIKYLFCGEIDYLKI